ncbi:hypothetical protein O181_040397 [Austropuccinia psidii MF-1]|uniref:Uncharacterized protein n=1 Tax=Austropuccinia psidii MF-1 TaxID=1389203 RepID=A0A9Q3HDU6_9BASI|nr:hypothetical protein [Austropuccinia psidii MF-1]
MFFKQTPRQPNPGPSGIQWWEDSFGSKQKAIPFLILTFNSSELTLPPFVEPSQYNEPPIPGPSPSSKPHEDVSASHPATPHLVIFIDNMPIGSPPPTPEIPPISPKDPTASSPHSQDEAWQEFTDLQQTRMIP